MQPSNVSLVNYTLNSATLKWSYPEFDGLDHVTVYLFSLSSGPQVIIANRSTEDGGSMSATILSLRYNIPYTFEVRAVNGVGVSPAGAMYNFTIVPEGTGIYIYMYNT